MFIGRKEDGTIYGIWTVKQWEGQEELADNHADIIAFTTPDPKVELQKQINSLERVQMMPRLTRELSLALMVSTAASAGLTEPQLYAANIGYRKLKDFEAIIVALRDQLAVIV